MTVLLLAVAAATSVTAAVAAVSNADWRALENGVLILEDLYLDQTGVVVVPQPGQPGRARWVMTITRNSLPEGNRGEHVECLYSDDAGATWSTPTKLEPGAGTPGGLTHAYSAILAADFGCLYVTYSLNLYNVTRFPDGTPFTRDDTLGQYVARWSDDSGATWSPERILLPLRTTAIDRGNDPFNGAVMLFWSVDVPKRRPDGDNATVFLGFSKLGAYMGTGDVEEAFIMASPNLATERNVSKIVWNTLPDGDTGITSSPLAFGAPSVAVVEENHVVPLSAAGGGGCMALARSNCGSLLVAATRDPGCGAGWGPTHPARFWDATPAAALLGAGLRNPRGPPQLRRLSGGRYLLAFYNNGDPSLGSRNPYWLAAGVEDAGSGEVRFSQPEVFVYAAQYYLATDWHLQTRPGYPDIVEDPAAAAVATPACPTPDGRGCTVFFTCTNKTQARAFGIPPDFLAALLAQDTLASAASRGLALSFPRAAQNASFATPPLAAFLPQAAAPFQSGWAVEFYLAQWTVEAPVRVGQALLDCRAGTGRSGAGFAVELVDNGDGMGVPTLALSLRDDAGTPAVLTLGKDCAKLFYRAAPAGHHVAFIVDGAARVAMAVVDGFLCNTSPAGDGGARGWAFLPMNLTTVHPTPSFVWGGPPGRKYAGQLSGGRWYARALSVTEAVGNSRAGPPAS